jgi:hypothetical protein
MQRLAAEHAKARPVAVACLGCGRERVALRLRFMLAPAECPACGYVGWRESASTSALELSPGLDAEVVGETIGLRIGPAVSSAAGA